MLFAIIGFEYLGIIHPQLRNLLLGIVFSAMILSFIKNSTLNSNFAKKCFQTDFCRAIGISSYPMYLLHGSIIVLVASNTEFNNWINSWIFLSLVSCVVSYLAKDVLENPVMRWRQKILVKTDKY